MPASPRKPSLALTCILAALLSGCASRSIPLVNLTDAGHQWVWPHFLDGQPTVLCFWNTNEMECYRNVPALQGLNARDTSVQLVTVVTGRDRLEIAKWIREKRIRYPVLLDLDEELAGQLAVSRFPTFIFFDTQGREIERLDDIRLVKKWFDSDRWLEKAGAVEPASARAVE
jgi:hypothetical protein